ncbi:MAG: DUF2384 domain-containing protein [Aeromicrobium sp.]|nr:DUF2384 domain-containing protein [Burkholderiales bacterium]
MAKSESNKAVANLMEWMRREQKWGTRFEAIHEVHTASTRAVSGLPIEGLLNVLGDEGAGVLFGCVFEDLAARRFNDFEGPPHNIVDDYLKRRGWRDSVPSRRYMAVLRDVRMSVFEVSAVMPGKWVEVRDLVRGGEPVHVSEHLGSKSLVRWDRLGARVAEYQSQKIFTGVMLPLSNEQSGTLLQQIEAKISESLADKGLQGANVNEPETRAAIDDALATLPPTFTACWLSRYIAVHEAPEMVNFEGDLLVFAETRFAVRKGSAAQVVARLDVLPDWRRVDDAPPVWDWLGTPDLPREPQNSAAKGFSLQTVDPDTGQQVLAMLRLEKGTLQLSTNSTARMKRATELLEGALGEEISAGLTSLTPARGALRQASERQPNNATDTAKIPLEVVTDTMRQFFDRHYRDWLDSALPALDGRSPRQAVATESGQDEVVALLKTVENMEARQSQKTGQPPYNFGWLWQELGLAARRR